MNQHKEPPPLPTATRSKVARDMMVFQAKLFVDGFKDLLMSPLSIAAGLLGIMFSYGNPGKPLYEVMRLGKRMEGWINLFSASYLPAEDDHEDTGQKAQNGADDANAQSHQELAGTDVAVGSTTSQGEKEGGGRVVSTPRDFDALVDQLQATLLDPEARSKLSETSRNQLTQVTRKLLKEPPSNEK